MESKLNTTAPLSEEKGSEIPKKYYCTMDKGFGGLEKHHWNTLWLAVAHIFGIHGGYFLFTGVTPASLSILLAIIGVFAGLGITVGCHRYWSHKAFKAKLPLQILLAFQQTLAVQYPIFKWCRDHRLHHKYVETDADPYTASRGFYFSHMGWLFEKEHPLVKEKESTIDMSDLDEMPVVRFQTKYYWYLLFAIFYPVPMSIIHYFFPTMKLYQVFCSNYLWYIAGLHCTWSVNSAAHLFGGKPYDKKLGAAENRLVAFLAIGEGFHNYHHVFPWDYKAAELGLYKLNISTLYIDFFAYVGWAYDLKTVPKNVVMSRVQRTGDEALYDKYIRGVENTSISSKDSNNDSGQQKPTTILESLPPWGWGDADIPEEHVQCTLMERPSKLG